MEQAPGASFEAVFIAGVAGLVGTVEVAIIDNDGVTVVASHTTGIIENVIDGVPTGTYTAELIAPVPVGQYSICWSPDGTWNPIGVSCEDLVVVSVGTFPPLPPPVDGGPADGPCTAWVTGQQVAECCDATVGSDFALFDDSIVAASELLFELSGRRYAGTCSQTVRPCATRTLCGVQVLSRGHIVTWDGLYWVTPDAPRPCGCQPLSRVLLPGYPVRAITQVKIDGAVVPATEYRLDDWRWLVHKNGEHWPSCQRLDLDDTATGTFSVTYTYGKNPSGIAQLAAIQLACEIYKSCNGDAGECLLPAGVTRITRAGVTIERTFFRRDPILKVWRTGLSNVDAFLNAVNPSGLLRRPTFYTPDGERYARRVGS